jgi:hypothetical protein
MKNKTSKFASILRKHAEVVFEEDSQSSMAVKKNGLAKSKDPNYLQVSAYIPASLSKTTKINLLDTDMNFSDLIGILLSEWNEKQSNNVNT